LEKLVEAIKNDIVNAEQLGDSSDKKVTDEKEWVASEST